MIINLLAGVDLAIKCLCTCAVFTHMLLHVLTECVCVCACEWKSESIVSSCSGIALRPTYTRQLLSLATRQLHRPARNIACYILQIAWNRQVAYSQVTCRMYHAIFCAQRAQTMKFLCRQRQNLPRVCWPLV